MTNSSGANRVAIGRATGNGRDANIAARAGAILNHERLAENVLQPLRQNPSQHIGRAPGRIRDDDAHRMIRPTGVFTMRSSHSHCADSRNRCQDLAAAWQSAARLHLIASRRFLITSAGFFGHSTMWPSGRHLYCGSRDLPNDFSFATFLAVFFIAYPSVSVLELKAQESCGPPVAGRGTVASVRDGRTADKCGWRQSKS